MSRTSFFSPALFTKNLRRGWPIWVGYLILWLMILPVNLVTSTRNVMADDLMYQVTRIISNLSSQWAILICFIFAGVTAMAVFNYMYSSRSAGMMHALPMTRLCLFTTSVISGLAFLLIPNLLIFLITAAVVAAVGVSCWKYLFMWLYVVCGLCLFFFIFAAFCAQFTGNILALPVFYTIMNFLAIFLESMVNQLMRDVTFGFNSRTFFLGFLSPLYYFFANVYTNYAPYDSVTGQGRITELVNGYENLIWYILAALVLAVVSHQLYRRRQVESAGDIVAIKPMYHFFRWGVAFCASLGGSFLLMDVFNIETDQYVAIYFGILAVISGIVGWFAAEMLLKKSFKVFNKRNWLKLGIYCLALVAFVAALDLDLFGYERRIPDPEQVDYVVVESTRFDSIQEITMVEELHQDIISSKKELEDFRYNSTRQDTYSEDGQFSYYYMIYFNYYMKDGSTLYRKYPIPITNETQADRSSLASRLDQMLNTPDKLRQRNITYDMSPGNISMVKVEMYEPELQIVSDNDMIIQDGWATYNLYSSDAQELASAIERDILEGNLGREYIFPSKDTDINVAIIFNDPTPTPKQDYGAPGVEDILSEYYYLNTDCVHTLEVIERVCVTPNSVS